MRRREFIAGLGGAAAALPVVARAQQAMPVAGFLRAKLPDGITELLGGSRLGLKEAGYVESENVTIEYRWVENQTRATSALANVSSRNH